MPTAVTHWSDAMFTSLAAAMALLFSAIPKIIGFERIALSWPRALGIALLAAGAALTLKR